MRSNAKSKENLKQFARTETVSIRNEQETFTTDTAKKRGNAIVQLSHLRQLNRLVDIPKIERTMSLTDQLQVLQTLVDSIGDSLSQVMEYF